MIPFRHSIQWRIFTYYTVLISVVVIVLIAVFHFFEKQAQSRLTQLELHKQVIKALPFFFLPSPQGGPPIRRNGGVTPSNTGQRPRLGMRQQGPGGVNSLENVQKRLQGPRFKELLIFFREENLYLYVRNPNGEVLYRSDDFPEALTPEDTNSRSQMNWNFLVTDSQFYILHQLPARGALIIGKPRAAVASELNELTIKAVSIGLLVIAVSSACGFWIIRFSLKPIQQISDAAERIANGNITEQIDTKKVQSELGQLADVLNRTFGRLGEALKRQIQFTSDASHELRTPVAAILADCQFSLKRERSPERYRETIEVCHESAQHMRSLIEDLRELADFDEKNDSMVSELVDMKEFISNVVSVMRPLADEKGLVLKAELEEATVYLDPMRMRQAVLNLLNNAVRYTDSAGEIFVRCIKQADSVIIEVCDTGIGIAPDKVGHIFDRFYRADAARNANTGGVGLGLAISKSIVEANGGTISVESKLGAGTCFRIRLDANPIK